MANENDNNPKHKLTAEEAVELAARLGELARSGLPLPGGLRALSEELPTGRLPGVLRDLARQVESGTPLDAAVASLGGRLPVHVRALVIAGVRSGRLADVLDEFVDLERSNVRLMRRLMAKLAYPLMLLSLLAFLSFFLGYVIIPQFAQIFADFDAELPVMTIWALQSSKVVPWMMAFLLTGVVVLLLLFTMFRGFPMVAPLVNAIPVVGPLWQWTRLAQFARLMHILLLEEVPLPEALRLAGSGVPDADLANGCQLVARDVEAGQPLSVALQAHRQFPQGMVPIVAWAEGQPQQIPDAFAAIVEMFEGRIESQGMYFESFILPMSYLMVITFAGFCVTALFMPLVSLVQKLT